MADRAAAYDYRAFMIQISDGLTQKDVENVVFLHELPVGLAKESPLTVLVKLEMAGITSANNPDDLAKLLKGINRHDLSKKVRDFAKKQRKGRSALTTPLQRLDQSAVNLSASLKLSLMQCKILLEQVENVKEEAEGAGFERVEEVVAEALTLISERLQKKLQYASKLLQDNTVHAAAQCGRELSDRDSPPSSPGSSPESSLELGEVQVSMLPTQLPTAKSQLPTAPLQLINRAPVRYVREREVKVAAEKLRTQTLPHSKANQAKHNPAAAAGLATKQPLVPPQTHRLPINKELAITGHVPFAGGNAARQLQAGVVVPRLEQGRSQGTTFVTQMVTGKLLSTNQLKPTPPPKPKKRAATTLQADVNQTDEDSIYDDVTTYSSTGDSGFGDSKEFLKVPLRGHYEPSGAFRQEEPSPCESHSYAALSVSTVNAGYYKSLRRDGIQEVQYAPQVVPPTVTASNPSTHYMNIANGKK